MGLSFVPVFSTLSVVLALFDFYISVQCFKKTNKIGHFLGLTGILAGIITISYLSSALARDYQVSSVSSSIYFTCIDWMLVFLVHFVFVITGYHNRKSARILRLIVIIYAIFDTLVFLVNIFQEIAIHYTKRQLPDLGYAYEMETLYIMHLIFTYIMTAAIILVLSQKYVFTPRQYRAHYLLLILAILFVIIMNALYLYTESTSPISQLDFSVIGYSIALYFLYWTAFSYRQKYMPRSLSMTIYQNIGQGIVLFDHQDQLIMHNKKADQLLSHIPFDEEMKMSDFLSACEIPEEVHDDDHYSLQCDFHQINGKQLRCDFTRLRDNAGKKTGNLFVFTDAAGDTDILTGFQYNEHFKRFVAENPNNFDHPSAVAIFDIIGLGEVNRAFGREVGDQRIRNLVKIIRKHMPADTYYVRGYEANLIAICAHCQENDIKDNVEKIVDACDGTVIYGLSATAHNRNVMQAVEIATKAMHTKKMLYNQSASSQTLASLVKALQECDSDTEAHVRRTQKMGTELGKRIGLTDAQMADLKLLCLLHDIGKIGIPLEILNKPGKLSDEEWKVLKTHPEKGYQIAMSSDELKSIAPMILSHHERWDGNGYPERLSGESIPILSRIIAIVDAYDAMVNDRAYRTALSVEAASEEIRKNAGTQFDPNLADAFLQMLSDMPDIALGEKTGGDEIRIFHEAVITEGGQGSTYPVRYSRYLLDMDDNIIETDEMFEEITGYPNSQATGGMSQFDLIPPDDRPFYFAQVNNQFAKGSIAFLEHNLQRRNGSIIRVYCYGKRYFDSAAKVYRSEILVFQEK